MTRDHLLFMFAIKSVRKGGQAWNKDIHQSSAGADKEELL